MFFALLVESRQEKVCETEHYWSQGASPLILDQHLGTIFCAGDPLKKKKKKKKKKKIMQLHCSLFEANSCVRRQEKQRTAVTAFIISSGQRLLVGDSQFSPM